MNVKTVETRGARIRYTDTGKGRAVVFLHGFLESREIWEDYAQALSRRYRVICIDLPGHGKSDCIGYVHRMERMADVVKDVLDELQLRRYILIGHSMGGYVSLAFAEKYVDNLRGLCLLHSTALADSAEKRLDRDRAIRVVKREPVRFTKPFIASLFAVATARYFSKEITQLRRIAARTSRQGIVAALEGMKIRRNREVVLKFAPYPVLLIGGKRDNVIPFETLKAQAALPADGKLVELERAGHMGFIETRDTVLWHLRRFFGRCYRLRVKSS